MSDNWSWAKRYEVGHCSEIWCGKIFDVGLILTDQIMQSHDGVFRWLVEPTELLSHMGAKPVLCIENEAPGEITRPIR